MGFVNPSTKQATTKAMGTYGSDYICHYNRWKNSGTLKYQLYL
ncbi:hypothetical protein [Thermoanaerobacter sp. RKWS2]|nr:hypothetical protein [Thermoanaerobacter sp. RKWS2]UZQ82918.1 hypothetical protein OEI98_002871 [Thermoanaerobacter sp. RKWS2]